MRGLIVNEAHFHQIRKGLKTQTMRRHKKPFKKGDLAVLKRNFFEPWHPITVVRISDSYRQLLGDAADEDARREGYSSLVDFKADWPRVTRTPWNPNMEVSIYRLELYVV